MSDPRTRYHEDGFLILPQTSFFEADFDGLYRRYQGIFEGNVPHNIPDHYCWHIGEADKVRKIDQAHQFDEDIRRLVSHPEIGNLAAHLTGAKRVSVWATHMLYKPPSTAPTVNVGWHTETKYLNFNRGDVIIGSIAISPIHENSGGMFFLRSSHQWDSEQNKVPMNSNLPQDLSPQEEQLRQMVPQGYQWEVAPLLAEPGGMSFHHKNLWHGSGANTSPESRLSISLVLHVEHEPLAEVGQVIHDGYTMPVLKSGNELVIYG